jgi:type VI protein secretion system component VasK
LRHYAVLRILLASFLLYIAWPQIPLASSQLASLFWGVWLLLFVLVLGSNLATLLQMTRPPILEQDRQLQRKTLKH